MTAATMMSVTINRLVTVVTMIDNYDGGDNYCHGENIKNKERKKDTKNNKIILDTFFNGIPIT